MNNNGDLSFNSPFGDYYPDNFPLYTPDPLIAPFWTDLLDGAVWYRITTNKDIIQRVGEEVASVFPEQTPFSATQVLIATWDNVGYFSNPTSQVNYYTAYYNAISLCLFFLHTCVMDISTESHLSMHPSNKWCSIICLLLVW